jgi:hypothetical protein
MEVRMQAEGIQRHMQLVTDATEPVAPSTLLCFVLVELSTGAHAFCSVYDFGPWPLLQGFAPEQLNDRVLETFRSTRTIMANGFVFDELSPEVVAALFDESRRAGAAIFFDPGTICNASNGVGGLTVARLPHQDAIRSRHHNVAALVETIT